MSRDLFYHVPVTAGEAASYDLSKDLTSFTIEEDASMADVLKIKLSDPYRVFTHAFQEGMEIEVDLGTVDDHSLVFRGRIYQVNAEFPQDEVPRLVISAHDNSMRMGLSKRKRAFKDKTLEQIVNEVASHPTFGFKEVDVQLSGNPKFNGNGLRQHDKTDRQFLLELATQFGAVMYVEALEEGDTLHFLSQHHVMNEIDPAVILYYGRCDVPERLVTFEASADVGNIQLPRVFTGLDCNTGELIQPKDADVPPEPEDEDQFRDENMAELRKHEPEKAAQLEALMSAADQVQEDLQEERGGVDHVAIPNCTTDTMLAEIAKNQFSTSLQGMRASGATVGNHRLHAQTTVEIADAGRFSGKWFLSKVQHVVDGQGYRTKFECQR